MRPVSWDEITAEPINESISRKMIWGEHVMVTKWELAPNASLPLHEHVSEQITMVERGAVLIITDEGAEILLKKGDMLIIPSGRPHAVRVGPEGCTAVDLFSPVRQDFIAGKVSYHVQAEDQEKDPYERLMNHLRSKGIKIPLERLKALEIELVARYAYEKECVTMGELKQILKIDKAGAKNLLRQWKHGDDHSESSYKRSLERIVITPPLRPSTPKKDESEQK